MRVLLFISILILGACARQPEAVLPTAWARADGQRMSSALLDIDSMSCRDDMQSPDGAAHGQAGKNGYSRAMVEDFISCMRSHGYVQIKS
jgi:hypothetical protein